MKILIVNSAKGGVGKSFVTTETAKALKKLKQKVAIIDLDVTTPNIEVLNGITTITPPKGPSIKKASQSKYLTSNLKRLKNENYDWVLVDTPPTISDTYHAMYASLKHAMIIFVTTPSKNALQDTGISVRFFAGKNIFPYGVIQNMVGEHFGEAVDTEEMFNLKTLSTIPLLKEDVKDTSEYFEFVKDMVDVDFDSEYKETVSQKVFEKYTLEEVEQMPFKTLRFFNLETWEYVREKLVERDETAFFGRGLRSPFDVSTSELKLILDEGEIATVQIIEDIPVKEFLFKWEIQECQIKYDNPISKGLPMFMTDSGTYLWPHEVRIVQSEDIDEILRTGGVDMGNGHIIPSLGTLMYLNRVFDRKYDAEAEYKLVREYLERVPKADIDTEYMEFVFEQLGETDKEHIENILELFSEKKEKVA